MNTRSIIEFMHTLVAIRDEYNQRIEGRTLSEPRVYSYSNMSPSSYMRLVRLQDHANSIVRLVAWPKLHQTDTLIYWKREHPRPRHD